MRPELSPELTERVALNPSCVVVIVGPTGTGKSDLSLDLAEQFNGEIVNTDAMQFYRGMDIGTAKLPVDERRGIAHHLLDTMDVTEEASVAAFQSQARTAIDDIVGRGKRAILVGGSGLYVRAAIDHLEFPPTDPKVREVLEVRVQEEGLEKLVSELQAVDPESAQRLHDERRIIRALEVFHLTGRPFTSFMPQRDYLRETVQIGLDMERPTLHERLALRVHRMVEAGLLDEVERLERVGLREGKTASRAIGYQQFLNVVDGKMSVDEAKESTIIATRQFARRQVTWFKADPRVTWLKLGS